MMIFNIYVVCLLWNNAVVFNARCKMQWKSSLLYINFNIMFSPHCFLLMNTKKNDIEYFLLFICSNRSINSNKHQYCINITCWSVWEFIHVLISASWWFSGFWSSKSSWTHTLPDNKHWTAAVFISQYYHCILHIPNKSVHFSVSVLIMKLVNELVINII